MSWWRRVFGDGANKMTRYYNSKWGFSVVYPCGWQVLTENRPAGVWEVGVGIASTPVGGYRCGLTVNARCVEVLAVDRAATPIPVAGDGTVKQAPRTPTEYIEQWKEELRLAFSDLRFHSSEETSLVGALAARLAYSYATGNCRTWESSLTIFCRGRTYQIICEIAEHQVGMFKPMLDAIISGFNLEGLKP